MGGNRNQQWNYILWCRICKPHRVSFHGVARSNLDRPSQISKCKSNHSIRCFEKKKINIEFGVQTDTFDRPCIVITAIHGLKKAHSTRLHFMLKADLAIKMADLCTLYRVDNS